VTDAYDPGHDNQIAHLLKLAGRRPSPSADRVERAREATRAEWSRVVRARGRRRSLAAIVATLAIGVLGGAGWWWASRFTPGVERPGVAPEVAMVQRVLGSVRITDAADRPVDAAAIGTSRPVRAGDRVEVAEQSGAAFELVGGTSVRLAAGTAVIFGSNSRLDLARGILYVDSNPARHTGPLVVDTSFGSVSHVGTQFEVRLQPDSLGVRVREGEVTVESREGRLTSKAGEALIIRRDGPAERSRIATAGPEWAWITTIAPPFTLEGSTVSAFLQWVSREQGWRWEYADAATRRLAERTVLHGSIDELTPEEALLAVLPASGLTSTRLGDRLVISVLDTPATVR
jgi:ferric-dicitrate binding protein FerR (iron transport regulator)